MKVGDGTPGPGRPKGSVNKTTATMKAAIQSVYDKLQEERGGNHGHFLNWAKSEPTEFYRLASKLIPIQVGGDEDNPIRTVVRVELIGGDRTDQTPS